MLIIKPKKGTKTEQTQTHIMSNANLTVKHEPCYPRPKP